MVICWRISRTGGGDDGDFVVDLGEDDDLMSRQTWALKIYTKLRPWGSERREVTCAHGENRSILRRIGRMASRARSQIRDSAIAILVN
jgi:hypothetical protein